MTGSSKVIERRQLYLVTRAWETGYQPPQCVVCPPKAQNHSRFRSKLTVRVKGYIGNSSYWYLSVDLEYVVEPLLTPKIGKIGP